MEKSEFITERTRIISEMLDNPNEHGIYPTTKCFKALDELFDKSLELTASEAIYGFCGWLTTRKTKTIMSASNNAAVIADLVKVFCNVNNLSNPRDGWEKNLTHPE